jgi:hypothetical protein
MKILVKSTWLPQKNAENTDFHKLDTEMLQNFHKGPGYPFHLVLSNELVRRLTSAIDKTW